MFTRLGGASPLFHCRRRLHICHLWGKHQRTPIIASVEIDQDLRCFGWLILLDEVAGFRKDL